MKKEEYKGIKQVYPGKYLFHLNSKDIYYLTLEAIDINNIEVMLIKLLQRETYVYKSQIPFKSINPNENSVYDVIKNLNYSIYNFNFSLSNEFNKITLLINNQTKIELCLYNKNMNEKNKNEKNIEAKKNMDKLKDKMNSLLNIVSMQKNKIAELKQKEESQIKLINKIEEVSNKINLEYQQQMQNNNNNMQHNNMINNYPNNNNNYNNSNDKKKYLYKSTFTNMDGNSPQINDSNSMNMNYKKNPKFSVSVNVALKPYLADNTNPDNLLTRPQYMNPYPQKKQPFMKTKSINLDNIPDYRYSNSNSKY